MVQVRVSSEAVAGAASQTVQKAAEFEGRVTALQSLVSQTIGASWRGQAADAFDADFQQWLSGAAQVHEALVTASGLLEDASVVYDSTERAVTQAASDSHVRSGAEGTR